MAQIKELTKGKTLINGTTGAEYVILTKAPRNAGTAAESTHFVMVRHPLTGRGFDLFLSQASLDSGAYALKS